MLFDDAADLGDDRGHVDATGLEVAAARVEHRLHFLGEEGHVAALAEHRRDDAGGIVGSGKVLDRRERYD